METKAHHALVGFFAMFLVAAGGFFILWLSAYSGNTQYADYDIVFDGPVRGLRETGEVRFNGIPVGEVTSIELDTQNPNRVIARVRVAATTPVRVDSSAQLEPQGLTGLAYIQITGGSPESQRLYSPAGRPPPRIYAVPAQLDSLFQGGEDVLEAANRALIRISALLNEENLQEFAETLENLNTLTNSLAEDDRLIDELSEAIATLNQTGRDISAAAVALQQFGEDSSMLIEGDLGRATRETAQAAIDLQVASTQAAELLETIRPQVERFSEDGLTDLTLAANDLRRLIATMERIAIDLEDNPSGFISGEPRRTVEVPR
ncbi:MlaD family protein [Hyphobacterium marinum]|uniref:MlaD family protein n=1 Tax=Hyphobacterium marinum TaxID=3116574 RepID=A0ABU7M146_9PROT|nr:MlaD family protein [Hyphobacterium sp. Y6023]MEE2566985.1 MlaD family protein [Hyphobacterium sp. Y6023]